MQYVQVSIYYSNQRKVILEVIGLAGLTDLTPLPHMVLHLSRFEDPPADAPPVLVEIPRANSRLAAHPGNEHSYNQ